MKNDWQTKNLGDLCRVRTGRKDVNEGNPDGEFPFFTCAAEHTFSDNYSFDTEALLIAGNGDVGKVSYYNGKFEAYQRTYVLSDFIDVLPRFLFLILDGKLKETVSKQKLGNTMPYIKVGMLTDFHLPVPPLAEQQRIVGLLDEAFKGIATAKANAEKNLQNARALFESYLQSVFTQRGPGWVEKPLGEVADLLDCLHKTPTYAETGFPMVRVTDIKPGLLDLSKTRKVDEQTFIAFSKGRTPRAGDIVFSRVGSCGVSALVSSDEPFCLGQNTVFILPKINSMLLYHFLNSPNAKEQFKEFIDGTTQPTISMKSIRQVAVPIAPPAEHSRLVASLDSMREETQRLFRLYERKIVALEALNKSLLHQAFSGEL